mmetsp:Transcript_9790/g.25350  ORF Transcript_9790/g.25350 Transcript_9790/m.25350 type:complete len:222 (+) Transcript_9790:576-1241(+)
MKSSSKSTDGSVTLTTASSSGHGPSCTQIPFASVPSGTIRHLFCAMERMMPVPSSGISNWMLSWWLLAQVHHCSCVPPGALRHICGKAAHRMGPRPPSGSRKFWPGRWELQLQICGTLPLRATPRSTSRQRSGCVRQRMRAFVSTITGYIIVVVAVVVPHTWSSHMVVSSRRPVQGLPPPLSICIIPRCLRRLPSPQVAEQSVHADHSSNAQSTACSGGVQ